VRARARTHVVLPSNMVSSVAVHFTKTNLSLKRNANTNTHNETFYFNWIIQHNDNFWS